MVSTQQTCEHYARMSIAFRILPWRRSTLLSKKVILFTTNIDLFFEVSFERLGVGFNDGFSGKNSPAVLPRIAEFTARTARVCGTNISRRSQHSTFTSCHHESGSGHGVEHCWHLLLMTVEDGFGLSP